MWYDEAMQLTSPAFLHEGVIPPKYTCDGLGVNPPLEFKDIPHGTVSLVLLMDDPDVPMSVRPDKMFDHWVVYNIPPHTIHIEDNTTPPGVVGINTAGANAYAGCCPPDKEHRYFFNLFALDTNLDIPAKTATKQIILDAIEGHILAQATLMGRYKRLQ